MPFLELQTRGVVQGAMNASEMAQEMESLRMLAELPYLHRAPKLLLWRCVHGEPSSRVPR